MGRPGWEGGVRRGWGGGGRNRLHILMSEAAMSVRGRTWEKYLWPLDSSPHALRGSPVSGQKIKRCGIRAHPVPVAVMGLGLESALHQRLLHCPGPSFCDQSKK